VSHLMKALLFNNLLSRGVCLKVKVTLEKATKE
jgi:hypothetical protein